LLSKFGERIQFFIPEPVLVLRILVSLQKLKGDRVCRIRIFWPCLSEEYRYHGSQDWPSGHHISLKQASFMFGLCSQQSDAGGEKHSGRAQHHHSPQQSLLQIRHASEHSGKCIILQRYRYALPFFNISWFVRLVISDGFFRYQDKKLISGVVH